MKQIRLKANEYYDVTTLSKSLKFVGEQVVFRAEGNDVLVQEVTTDAPVEEERDKDERRTVKVKDGGLKLAMANLFNHSGASELVEEDMVMAMAFKKNWCSPTRAKDIIATCLVKGVLKKSGDNLSPTFSIDVQEPVGMDYSYLKDAPSGEVIKGESAKPPPKKKIPWSSIKLKNDRCKRCTNKGTPECDACFRWSNCNEVAK